MLYFTQGIRAMEEAAGLEKGTLSPVTVRKWLNEGYLECNRTPRGHIWYTRDQIKRNAEKIKGEGPQKWVHWKHRKAATGARA